MQINIASRAGFCFGVNRAVEMTRAVLAKKDKPVFSLGPIIHNPEFMDELKGQGLTIVDSLDGIPEVDGYFVIRSHGTTPDVIESAINRGLEIIDTTCPFVQKAQEAAKEFHEKKYEVVIFGDADHAEVIGINGYAKNSAKVVFEIEEIEMIDFNKSIGVLSQTTQKNENYQRITEIIQEKAKKEVTVQNTICLDSTEKKEEMHRLAQENDVVLIVGGKISNNTKKLAEVSQKVNAKTYHIERPDELQSEWFSGAENIVIGAGASTPDSHIEEVERAVRMLFAEKKQEISIKKEEE